MRIWSWLALFLVGLVLAGCGSAEAADQRVALLFVGHGEPSAFADGDIPIVLADGTEFGPHAVDLGTPVAFQTTEWAAAYDEIATAMTYIFGDLNQNGTLHEVEISPAGDVPPFFTWDAFHASIEEYYTGFGDYSPHNDAVAEHVANVNIEVDGASVTTFLAYLDAVPRIPDVVWDITRSDDYDQLVVVPMLLSSSTHTQEVESFVQEVAGLTAGMDVVVSEPFFEVPYMRARLREAVVAMATQVRESVPADAAPEDIAVLLAAHGTPYLPPDPDLGWVEGDIFSNLSLTEAVFHEELAAALPWQSRTGRMNYSEPSIEASLAAFEADGVAHVMVIPSAFPTAAMHTMWDVANSAVGHAVLPSEGVVVHTRPSGMQVYYSAEGYADLESGAELFRDGLGFMAEAGVVELLAAAEADASD
jgi:protoheme ferro-lyase